MICRSAEISRCGNYRPRLDRWWASGRVGWDGTEAPGDALIDKINGDGTIQPILYDLEGEL
jgi:hypothetical protein